MVSSHMCGIAGILNPGPYAEELISNMVHALHHRGPDESGIYIDPEIALGHTRLSIIGLSNGAQPITNEDESLWIIFNGEIFNYPELRQDLIKRGHCFRTDTDTEVILHLYEEQGNQTPALLNGQFAFAIWDSVKKELFIARDRVGKRPLYFCNVNHSYLFASEIKALFTHPAITKELDLEALFQVFTYWTTLGVKSAFKNVSELSPGSYQRIKNGAVIEHEYYWQIPWYESKSYQGSFQDAVEELRSLLMDAISIRLRADVPVGAYLSGGLDSSIITSLIAKNFNNTLRTFSLGFQEQAYDETHFQREMVRAIGTDHSELTVSNDDIRTAFPTVVYHCEKPLLRTAPVPMYLLAGLVRSNNFKVVLTGEGADEIFAGYDIFKEAKIREFWSKQPDSTSRPLLLEHLHPYIFKDPSRTRMILRSFYGVTAEQVTDPLFSHRIRWNNTGKNRTFFSDELTQLYSAYNAEEDLFSSLPTGFHARDTLSRAQYLEMDIFLSRYLLSSQGDRVAMGNSLELRMPFLDFRVIDFAMQLPAPWKLHALNEKHILKKTFCDSIPAHIVSRPKQPYRAPIREVFFSGHDDYVNDMLSDAFLKETGYFNPAKVRHLVDKYRDKDRFITSETHNMALTGILSTQILHDQFINKTIPLTYKTSRITRRIIRLS